MYSQQSENLKKQPLFNLQIELRNIAGSDSLFLLYIDPAPVKDATVIDVYEYTDQEAVIRSSWSRAYVQHQTIVLLLNAVNFPYRCSVELINEDEYTASVLNVIIFSTGRAEVNEVPMLVYRTR